jgi:hypothetical protein
LLPDVYSIFWLLWSQAVRERPTKRASTKGPAVRLRRSEERQFLSID